MVGPSESLELLMASWTYFLNYQDGMLEKYLTTEQTLAQEVKTDVKP